jgi:hypothetical protein
MSRLTGACGTKVETGPAMTSRVADGVTGAGVIADLYEEGALFFMGFMASSL